MVDPGWRKPWVARLNLSITKDSPPIIETNCASMGVDCRRGNSEPFFVLRQQLGTFVDRGLLNLGVEGCVDVQALDVNGFEAVLAWVSPIASANLP